MAVSRRAVLRAILEECEQRRGPTPAVLVAIAVNAKMEAARTDVDAELLGLRQEGLIACRRDAHRGDGLVVTDAGRALAESKAAEPEADSADSPVGQPAPSDPERVDPATQPELFTLLCDMGSVISERLAVAIEAGDLHQAARMQQLGRQVLRHVGERG